ncbi:MAG: O-antigen ligase family protein, partial [Syntrophobacterales bacterium]|nr:O-antigen ligase family protein [Syntrophobacterales bacterium]
LGLFLKTPLNRPIAYYFIACVVSTMVGAMVGRVKPALGFFFVLKYFEYFVIYFMAVNHLREKKQVERFILTILVVCFVVCIIAMTQIPSGARVSAPFEGEGGEPNTLGGYLDFILALVLGLLLTNGMPRYRFFLFLLVPTILIVLMATLSRSSWLSLLPLILTLIVLSKKKMVLIVSVLFVVLTAPFILPKSVVDRALYTFTQPPEEGQLEVGQVRIDTSTSARIFSWKEVLSKDWVKHPVLGYGVTGYRFLDAQFPRVLVETGLLGFFAFILLLRSILKVSHSVYRQTEDPLFRGVALGYLAGFFALLAHAIGANTFIIVRIMEPFWFLTAIVVMTPQIEKPSSPPSTDTV